MKLSGNTVRIGIAAIIVVGTFVGLAYSGMSANESYYKNIAELGQMGNKAYVSHLRVHGFVQPGSIKQSGPNVTFVMNEFEGHTPNAATGRLLSVEYRGLEPPPDTFKDYSEAVAIGTYGRDGVLHATALQAKCASKYAPGQPGGMPAAAPTASPRASATPAEKHPPAPASN